MIAFFFTMPMRRMIPIKATTPRSLRQTRSARIAPTPADGNVDNIVIGWMRSEEHTSELQSQSNLVCRLLLEKKNGVGDQRGVGLQARPLIGLAMQRQQTIADQDG